MLKEGVHGRQQYTARTADSAPSVRGLHWLKNRNTQLQYRLYWNAHKDWRKELLEEYSKHTWWGFTQQCSDKPA